VDFLEYRSTETSSNLGMPVFFSRLSTEVGINARIGQNYSKTVKNINWSSLIAKCKKTIASKDSRMLARHQN
jgi:hypothetical protein